MRRRKRQPSRKLQFILKFAYFNCREKTVRHVVIKSALH